MRRLIAVYTLLLWLPLLVGPLEAQPRPGYAPTSTHIYPAGGQRGTTVDVQVGTECAPPATRWSWSGAGISADRTLGGFVAADGEPSPRRNPAETPITYPRQWRSTVTIADDAPLGTAHWQLHCAQGGTASRPFLVGELPEHLEEESNSLPSRAERISLPVTVNGRINGERDIDYFRFSVAAGQIVTCETVARRLGSQLDPLVQLLDSGGRPVRIDRTHAGNDPVFVFRAPVAGDYLVRIASVTKHGNPASVYRLNLTHKPFVTHAFPAGGQTGQTESVELFALSGDGETRQALASVTFPEVSGPYRYHHPEFSGTVQLDASNVDHEREESPNETPDAATPLQLPGGVDGRIDHARDVDWFAFSAERDTTYSFVCQAFPAWDACLPTLLVVDAAGKELARHRAIETDDGVARIQWKAPDTGRYFVRVRDHQFGVAGGTKFIYRLTARPAVPDFELRLASDNVDVMPGETTVVNVDVVRRGGFLGPVQLRFRGLPSGVTMQSAKVAPKQNSVKVKLAAAKNMTVGAHRVELVGQTTIAGKTMQRIALADHSGVDSQDHGVGPARLPHLQLTVRHPPLFRLFCAEAYQYAHRGSIYPYLMEVERLNGFDGEIVLQIGDRQNRDLDGIEMIETVIAPGQTSAMLPIYLPETMHINIQSQSQLYSQAYAMFTDRHGKPQSLLVLAEKRNMLRTLPPVVKLMARDATLQAAPGETVDCRLRLERTSNFPGPLRLTLQNCQVDAHTPAGGSVYVEPLLIAAQATEVTVPIVVPTDCTRRSFELTFRASAEASAAPRAVTEATVRLLVAAP